MTLPEYLDYRSLDSELVLKAVNGIPYKNFYEIASLFLNKKTLQTLICYDPADKKKWQQALITTLLTTPDGTDYEKLDLLNALCNDASL